MANNCNGSRCVQLEAGHTLCNLVNGIFGPIEYQVSPPITKLIGPGYDGVESYNLGETSDCTVSGTLVFSYAKLKGAGGHIADLGSDPNNKPPPIASWYSNDSIDTSSYSNEYYGVYTATVPRKIYIMDQAADAVQWSTSYDGYWRQIGEVYGIEWMYKRFDSTAGLCPPGTEFNPITGGCDEIDTWTWDEEINEYVPKWCVAISGEDNEIIRNGKYIFTIFISPTPEKEYLKDHNVLVWLSYLGGTAIEGLDFNGPDMVIIPIGKTSVTFEIDILQLTENKNIKISTTSNEYTNCGEYSIEILGDEYGKYFDYTDYENKGTTCCRYYSLHYNDWQSCRQIAIPQYPGMMVEDGKTYIDGEY